MTDDAIISPDTRRPHRLPPGQSRTHKWPVLHEGEVPPFDPATWDLTVFPVPLVNQPVDTRHRYHWGPRPGRRHRPLDAIVIHARHLMPQRRGVR